MFEGTETSVRSGMKLRRPKDGPLLPAKIDLPMIAALLAATASHTCEDHELNLESVSNERLGHLVRGLACPLLTTRWTFMRLCVVPIPHW